MQVEVTSFVALPISHWSDGTTEWLFDNTAMVPAGEQNFVGMKL